MNLFFLTLHSKRNHILVKWHVSGRKKCEWNRNKKKCLGWRNASQYRSLCNLFRSLEKKRTTTKKQPNKRTNSKRVGFFAYVFLYRDDNEDAPRKMSVLSALPHKIILTTCWIRNVTWHGTDACNSTHSRIHSTECILPPFVQQCERTHCARRRPVAQLSHIPPTPNGAARDVSRLLALTNSASRFAFFQTGAAHKFTGIRDDCKPARWRNSNRISWRKFSWSWKLTFGAHFIHKWAPCYTNTATWCVVPCSRALVNSQ